MGTAPSRPAPDFTEKRRVQVAMAAQAKDLADSLATLDMNAVATSRNGSLERALLEDWEYVAAKDPVISLSRTILSHTEISTSLLKRTPVVNDTFVFNTALPFIPQPITNQQSSGRCWLFSSTNVLRYTIAQHPGLGLAPDAKFQLSQSYLFFYDKLEKSNYYLENSIELADKELDDRLVQYLSAAPLNDGGQWDMVVNLLERYGVVPQPIYPESYSSSNSGRMDLLLTTKLREHALRLRKLDQALRETEWHVNLVNQDKVDQATEARLGVLRKKKEDFLREIYTMLTVCLGVPPSPTEKFTWEYFDKDKKARSWTGTPVEFYKAFAEGAKNKPTDAFSLINDPRNAYDALYTVDRLGNVWGGKPVRYVNTTSERMKQAVVQCIKANHPVFFGCDVGKFSNSPLGIMDVDIYDYEKAFGVTFGLTKAERLQSSESSMTHAMVITAVHVDEEGKTVRFKVENSWGDALGDKGFFIMTDKWFDEFVYQVVIPRSLAPKDLVAVLDKGEATVLPAWDPMGTLA
ncbi:hypothetical protein FRC15_003543 [Serendipita sp. 397]|nr:hypothetical protein FRC15_003543 [Serendipita sp. 397]